MEASTSASTQSRSSFARRYLILPKLLYIGVNMVGYSVHAYGTDFFRRQWDLKLSEIGYISALSGFNFIGSIFWSSVADHTGRNKTILVGCTASYAILMFALNLRFGSHLDGVTAKILYTAGCFGLAQFMGSALFPLVDHQVISLLTEDPALSKDTFGRQRLWGTFAHMGTTLLANQANKWYLQVRGDSPKLQALLGDYLGMFLILILSSILFITTVIIGIPNRKSTPMVHVDEEKSEDVKKVEMKQQQIEPAKNPTFKLLKIPAFLFFLSFVMISGIIRAAMSFFQTYFIIAIHEGKQEGKDQAAFIALPRILSEVGVYFFGKQLLHWFGPHLMLITSQATGILRMLGYALMPTSGVGSWIVPYFLELLKGLNSGLFSSSAVRLANDMSPHGCGNTAQGLVAGTYSGLSMSLGGIIGGIIVGFFPSTLEGERHGIQTMFFILSGSGAVFLVAFILKYWLVDGVLFRRTTVSQQQQHQQ